LEGGEIRSPKCKGGGKMAIFGSFIYNGISSASFGNIVLCKFSSIEDRFTQQKEALKGELNPWRDITNYYADKYSTPLTASVEIVKCNGAPFSGEEARKIRSWLLSPMGYRLLEIDDGTGLYDDIEFFAKFTVSKEKVFTGDINALCFEFECNAPYGTTKDRIYKFDGGDTILINNTSDDNERDYYPVIVITPKATGVIKIENDAYPGEVMELSVLNGNMLTINNKNLTIVDLIDDFNFSDDFNLTWIRLKHGINNITATGDCTGYFKCNYIRMVGV